MLSIGTCVLGNKPRIALALRDDIPRSNAEVHLGTGIDMIEMRVDQFRSTEVSHVISHLHQFTGIPCIGTIRSQQEGGSWKEDEPARRTLYQQIIPHVQAIDIEINADTINHESIHTAKKKGVCTIGSFHDFDKTPSTDALEVILEKGKHLKVDIVKIAAQCANPGDLRTLTQFLIDHEEEALIVIGMGKAGAPSRILFPFLGSLITYTFLGKPSAPGQFNCEETIQYLNGLST
ncbi:MAG: type I 3-dehydroquinate dehydratase [Candidatus Hydrogenedentes bacterium]|nr:type I 3-dehydroquinate dehydratase [Candidatus Hydrogenedentota bacterium]